MSVDPRQLFHKEVSINKVIDYDKIFPPVHTISNNANTNPNRRPQTAFYESRQSNSNTDLERMSQIMTLESLSSSDTINLRNNDSALNYIPEQKLNNIEKENETINEQVTQESNSHIKEIPNPIIKEFQSITREITQNNINQEKPVILPSRTKIISEEMSALPNEVNEAQQQYETPEIEAEASKNLTESDLSTNKKTIDETKTTKFVTTDRSSEGTSNEKQRKQKKISSKRLLKKKFNSFIKVMSKNVNETESKRRKCNLKLIIPLVGFTVFSIGIIATILSTTLYYYGGLAQKGSFCLNDSTCNTQSLLSCINNTCSCNAKYFFNDTLNKCVPEMYPSIKSINILRTITASITSSTTSV